MPKTALRLPALILFGIHIVYGCLLIPIMEYVAADWVLLNTVLYDVLDVFLNLFEVLGALCAFGFLIRAVYAHGVKGCKSLYFLIGGSIAFKYIASLISVSIVRGSLDLTGDFASLIVAVLIELAQNAVVAWMAYRFTASRREQNVDTNGTTPPDAKLFTFKPLVSFQNPLKKTAFWATVILTAVRLFSFIMDDIALGLPYAPTDVPITLLYWLILIFIPSCVGYFALIGCILLGERGRTQNK